MNESLPAAPSKRRDPATLIWLAVAAGSAIVLIYVAITGQAPPPSDRGPDSPAVGAKPSVLQFEPLTGDPAPLAREDLLGNITLINYWGPWCHFCREEMPHLLALREEFQDRDDFRLVLVSGGDYPDLETLRSETAEYMQRIKADAPTHHDRNSQSLASLARDARLPRVGFPLTVALDREGVVRGLWYGFVDEDAEQMQEVIADLLAARG